MRDELGSQTSGGLSVMWVISTVEEVEIAPLLWKKKKKKDKIKHLEQE